jgi:predicted metal-dependent HD superfamily phosphohydrolase
MMSLRNQFEQLCLLFNKDMGLINTLWREIEAKYTERGRHYHNLLHLENMFKELDSVKSDIADFTAISFLFSIMILFIMRALNPMRKTVL